MTWIAPASGTSTSSTLTSCNLPSESLISCRNPHVIKLGRLRRQADLDVAKALAIGQLSESHDAKLLGTSQRLRISIAAVAMNQTSKGRPWKEFHDLGEQGFAGVHGNRLREKTRKPARIAVRR